MELIADTATYAAHLVSDSGYRPDLQWSITFGLGGPAAGMFTAVAVHPGVAAAEPEWVIDQFVREIAQMLYGTAWAFHYRPDQYSRSIAKYAMTLRELVVVTPAVVRS